MEKEKLFEGMCDVIIRGEKSEAADLAREAIKMDVSPVEAIDKGFVRGIREIGERFDREECYLPELVMAADAMIAATDVLREAMKEGAERPQVIGRAVIGTVQGDIHDIGKNIVGTLFMVNGFEVVDLGQSVPTGTFVQKTDELKPDVVLMSALLTTTMPAQQDVIEALKQEGLRDTVKIMVGGAPVSQEWADRIGADGYGKNALQGISVAKQLLGV